MVTAGERIHVVGIAGSGAAGAALLLHHAGAIVDGCDADAPSPYTPSLDAAGIAYEQGHDPRHLTGVDRVAITPALRAVAGHAELMAAEARAIPVVTWQALLGELMAAPDRLPLAVTGTHGKSTTTALLGHLLVAAGLDPTVEVGAFIGDWGASVRPGAGAPFLVEADEFGDNFLNYHPAGAIVTNVEMDHPDYFADAAAVMASFERFVRGMGTDAALDGRLLVIAADDPGARELAERLAGWDGRIIRYGPGGDIVATNVVPDPAGTDFTLLDRRWRTPLAGSHNVRNATAALVMAHAIGADLDLLADGLRSFAGAGRRMELIADTPAVTIYDDYGHHPTEVRAALAAARQRVGPDRRLWAVFEPHMYSRTALLMDAFSTAFTDANEVVIAEIFASRDTPEAMAATSAEALADAIERATGTPAIAVGDVDATTEYVADHLATGDAVLVMGAGKSYRIARGLAERLAGERAS
ncbi:MAG TPA: UDP-N-acetylmuramate--L-alanine ligase [Candidatus Limnocylindria bacterium]|nr:UDP-N-acetylmuramate--L-alanine ligase [Candidatus Limnocylindria bacterium]